MTATALTVDGLHVSVARGHRHVAVVDGISFEVGAGDALGLVGESGSGKSLTLRALMALLPPAARVDGGTIALDGQPLPGAGRAARRARRGQLAMVFQDSLSALDPVQTVGTQVAEVPRRLQRFSRRRAWERAVELLALVGVPDAASRAHAYPHQLSGGLRQRVALAIAIATEPAVLLCDEPTTALDVTVQAQVLELIDDLRHRLRLAVVFVTHDLAVVRQVCEDVAVMYAGRLVEHGPAAGVLAEPLHPYTAGLLAAAVDLGRDAAPQPIPGRLPDPAALPAGCAFHPRCELATGICSSALPPLRPVTGSHASACHHADLLRKA